MKNNIFWCFLGFSIGTVWAFVGWIVLATVSMFSVPDVNDSSFDQMKQCRLESATITYRKKEKATGELQFIRFKIIDPHTLLRIQDSIRIRRVSSSFRTVEFEPQVVLEEKNGSGRWRISFCGGLNSELTVWTSEIYGDVALWDESFYNEIFRLCLDNEKKLEKKNSFEVLLR